MIIPMIPMLPYTSSTFTIDAATDALGAIFIAQKTGTLDRLFCTANANTSPPSYLARIESVSGGRPSNTIIASGASVSFTPSTLNTLIVNSMGTPYAITKGDMVAVTIQHNSGTIGASNFSTLNQVLTAYPAIVFAQNGAGYITSTASYSSWSTGISNTGFAAFGALYDDGDTLGNAFPMIASVTNTNVPTSGTDSYYGNVFTAPATLDCVGWVGCGQWSGSCSVTLYDSNNIALASTSISSGVYLASASVHAYHLFSSTVKLVKGQTYRLIARNSSGTVSVVSSRCDLANYRPRHLIHDARSTTSSNGTSWSDDNARFASLAPLVDFSSGVRMPNIRGGADQ